MFGIAAFKSVCNLVSVRLAVISSEVKALGVAGTIFLSKRGVNSDESDDQ